MARERMNAGTSWLRSHWLWFALLILVFAPTIGWLLHRWTINIYVNGHGIFVPLIVAYLVRENLKSDPIREPDSSAWGFLFIAAGLSLLILDTTIRTELLAATGLVVCLPGLSLLLLGKDRTYALLFPLLISTFMLPIPAGAIAPLHLVLRYISAWGSEILVRWYGIPILREDTTFLLPGSVLEVADACSGMSTLFASVLLGLILSYSAHSWTRRIAIMVAGITVAIVCNIIRVAGLTLIVHYWGVDPLETFLHEGTGLVAFIIVLITLFWVAEYKSEAPPK